jgi:nickel-dependent lactate racemase
MVKVVSTLVAHLASTLMLILNLVYNALKTIARLVPGQIIMGHRRAILVSKITL